MSYICGVVQNRCIMFYSLVNLLTRLCIYTIHIFIWVQIHFCVVTSLKQICKTIKTVHHLFNKIFTQSAKFETKTPTAHTFPFTLKTLFSRNKNHTIYRGWWRWGWGRMAEGESGLLLTHPHPHLTHTLTLYLSICNLFFLFELLSENSNGMYFVFHGFIHPLRMFSRRMWNAQT
jgi:hypothetical protein